VDSCLKGEINIKPLHRALTDLGNMTNAPKLSDVNVLINDAAAKQVVKIIAGEYSRKADTTINGLFKFNKVLKGNYLLYAVYKDSFVNGFWLTQITVKEDAQFDLNNNTFKEGRLDYYLRNSIANANR